MTPRETIKRGLLNYPGIFPVPLAVSCHLFTVIGNGYEWDENGELVCNWSYGYEKNSNTMKYSDLDERMAENDKRLEECGADRESIRVLYEGWKLEIMAERMQRQFTEQHIDTIVKCDCTYKHLRYTPGSYTDKGICVEYARAFCFPDNITPEWGEALREFLDWWLVRLNTVYGVSMDKKVKGGEPMPFWPEEIKKAYVAIVAAKTRLWPLIRNGQTYAEHCEESRKCMETFLNEIKKQEAIEKS